MNCFEARNSFAPFWRKSLDAHEREVLLKHLRECARCDRAFRVFALTGSLLYGDPAPVRSAVTPARSVAATNGGQRPWRAMCAMLAMVVAAGFAAYLAAAVPRQTLDQALTNPDSTTDSSAPFGQGGELQTVSFNDLAG